MDGKLVMCSVENKNNKITRKQQQQNNNVYSSSSSLAKGFGFIGSGVARKPLAREDASLLTCRKNLEKAVLCCEEFLT